MSNRIQIVRGTADTREIDLVDDNGEPLTLDIIAGASAELLVRANPAVTTNAIDFTTTGTPASLAFIPGQAVMSLSFVPADTSGLALQEYFYQLTITSASGAPSVFIEWTPFDVILGGSATPQPPPFPNTVKIDENFRLPNDMTYMTPGGSPIVNAQVRVYLKSDYDAGKLDTPIGITTTNAFGGWQNPVLVQTGFTYVARFEKPNEFGPNTKEFFA